jgi:hypothetical protein
MKKILLLITVLMLVSSSVSFGEVVSRILSYNGPGNQLDQCNAITQDKGGFVYATGVSWGGASKEDYATIKFGENGDFLWVARYNGSGNNLDHASAITCDNAGNVYVTGWSRYGSGEETEEIATIKYNTNGTQMWVAKFNGNMGDCHNFSHGNAIVVDGAGNVYVTGESHQYPNSHEDYITLKYSPSGVLLWSARYNGSGTVEDMAYSLGLDAAGNVYVTGKSCGNGAGYDIVTIKYNGGNGAQQWAIRYNGPGNSYDAASELVVDKAGNVFVTGTSHGGSSTKLDYVTIKYNSAGQQQWLKRFNGTASDTDAATALDLDVFNNVYVTGYSKSTGTAKFDYCTIKYGSYDGSVIWTSMYNGGAIDKAWDIKIVYKPCPSFSGDNGNNGGTELDVPCWLIDIYVTGQSAGTGTSNDFMTIRYDESGAQKWANRFNGPTNGNDAAYSISVLNGHPILYVGGLMGNDYGVIGITEQRPSEDIINTGFTSSYPNPFNPETKISFVVAKESNVKIIVYDMLGKTVAVLADSKYDAGTHSINFNAVNLNSGVYFYRYETDYASETRKIVLIK